MIITTKPRYHTASELYEAVNSQKQIQLPTDLVKLTNGLLKQFEMGCINLIETDTLGTEKLNYSLHQLFVQATKQNTNMYFVDNANMLDPHLLPRFSFGDSSVPNAKEILQNLDLARPFQYHQTVSNMEKLVKKMKEVSDHSLIITTDITKYFFNTQVEQVDEKYPIPQLQKFHYTVDKLRSIALMGHTVLITNNLRSYAGKSGSLQPDDLTREIHTILRSEAQLYLRSTHEENHEGKTRAVELLDHPYRPPASIDIELKEKTTVHRDQQAISEYFSKGSSEKLKQENSKKTSMNSKQDTDTKQKDQQRSLNEFFDA